MSITYQTITSEFNIQTILRTNADGTTTAIPADPSNSDYQAYLASLDGNTSTGLNPTA